MKATLRRRAYREAAVLLETGMDAYDLPPDLSEKDESLMREFIRIEIVKMLRRHGEPRRGSFEWLKKQRFGESGPHD
jgi:hypothetical protein